MIRFFQRLLRAFRATVLSYQYDAFVDSEEGWDSEDTERLTAFASSLTGEKLLKRISNFAIRSSGIATDFKTDEFRYHAGVAHGIKLVGMFIGEHMNEKNFRQALVAKMEQPEHGSLIHPGVTEFALR